MLYIYTETSNIEDLIVDIYNTKNHDNKTYNFLLKDLDVIIMNQEKYVNEDVLKYLSFFKYTAMGETEQVGFFINFDKVNLKLQNKFLKLFEESALDHYIFINNSNEVLDTVMSRGEIIDLKRNEDTSNYPSRYSKLINSIEVENDEEIDMYIKLYDMLVKKDYKNSYILYTTKLNEYNYKNIYEVIQLSFFELEKLYKLQECLLGNTNKNLCIENMLCGLIGEL